jgi:4-amino-4-deoxy-L-arabinose transferase-like glycosyltransferase
MKTKILYALIVILVLVHVWLVLPAIQYPLHFQLRDSYEYLDVARTLLSTGHYAGTEYPGIDLLRSPGYPLFLLVGLWLGNGWTGPVAPMQVLIMFLTAWILYRICAELGHRQVGLVAVIFYLSNPNATFWSMVLLSETLSSFWLVLGIWCFVHFWKTNHCVWIYIAGLSLAAGALTRPIVLPLAIALGVLFFILEWRMRRTPIQSLKLSGLFFLGLILLVIPWNVRNLVVHRQFTLSEVGGSTFQNWYIAKTLASAEGYSRDEAASIIANSPNPLKYSLGVIRQYPVVFLKEQIRGDLRTLLGAEYGTWAKVMGGEETATTGVLSTFIDLGSPTEVLRSLASQAKNPWFWAGIYAFVYDIVLFTAILIGFWRVLRYYRQELIFNLTVMLVLSLFYLLFIPGPAGESRFRAPADPLLALAAGLAFLHRKERKVSEGDEPVRSPQPHLHG